MSRCDAKMEGVEKMRKKVIKSVSRKKAGARYRYISMDTKYNLYNYMKEVY